MAWVRFDPGFTRHPKRLASGPVASWLWAACVDYAVQHMTDGYIPEAVIPTLVPGLSRRELAKSVDVLVELHALDKASGGYQVHDFADYQELSAEVRRLREAGKQRATAWRQSRRTNGVRSPERTANERRTYAVSNATCCPVLF